MSGHGKGVYDDKVALKKAKGKGKGAAAPIVGGSARKPMVDPKAPMKALWWTRFVAPENDDDSIWLHVKDAQFEQPLQQRTT